MILGVTSLLVAVGLLAQAVPAAPEPYVLEAGDQIEIRFFYNPELNDKADIRPDGKISMPLIGQVMAAGKTVEQLTDALREQYKSSLKQSEVTVQVRSYAGRKFMVGGDVSRPGLFPLYGTQTVLGAVMEAGGLRATSNRKSVLLVRRSPQGTPEVRSVALRAKGGAPPEAATIAIRPYDVVLVDESGVAKANRAIEQHVTKMLPFILTSSFTYLLGGTIVR